ncbi:hypothetical protein F0562_005577 [Nyssa sinensis]|uniref:Uncharacterized protein n=1 Tax=Nyssa sinensis TaxID=561372 RepID=A0A5J5AKW8_9ASTE|nr:hypothetical protein F0562_005577 [Nyssa sinensis]
MFPASSGIQLLNDPSQESAARPFNHPPAAEHPFTITTGWNPSRPSTAAAPFGGDALCHRSINYELFGGPVRIRRQHQSINGHHHGGHRLRLLRHGHFHPLHPQMRRQRLREFPRLQGRQRTPTTASAWPRPVRDWVVPRLCLLGGQRYQDRQGSARMRRLLKRVRRRRESSAVAKVRPRVSS